MSLFSTSLRASVLAGAVIATLALSACGRDEAPASPSSAAPAADARQAFTISGRLEGLQEGQQVSLLVPALASDPTKVEPIATATVHDGAFVLTGSVPQPVPGILTLGDHRTARLVVEPGELRVEAGELGAVARGGRYTDLVYGYLQRPEYVAAFKANREANVKAFSNIDETDEAAMTAARESTVPAARRLATVKNDYDRAILDGDAPTLVKLLVLSENYDWKRYDEARRAQMVAAFRAELGAHPLIVSMERAAEENAKARQLAEKFGPGKPYADIQAVGVDGKMVKLSQVLARNKLVLLDFWASWCGPCRGEFPHLLKVYREFHPHGFEIYAVSLDEDKADWTKAMHEEGGSDDLPWINLQAPGFEGEAAQAYGVMQLPQNYLIAGDGTIVGVGMREWDVERAVRAQLRKVDDAPAR